MSVTTQPSIVPTPTAGCSPRVQELLRVTGTTRAANADRMVDLFRFPAINNLGDVLDSMKAAKDPRGRRPTYPARALLATAACARVTGSLASALTELHHDEVTWNRCRDAFYQLTGIDLPDSPPTRDHVQEFRRDVARRGALPGLTREFTASAIAQAQALGNLTPGGTPDWAAPDRRNVVFGDGTIVPRYSDAEWVRDPLTREPVLMGSRAIRPDRARVQKEFRRSGEDGKHVAGINMVSLHTRTPFGLVVLAVGTELGAEQWTALDLADLVIAGAGDGVHTFVYDGAITGWAVDYLMAHHGVQVLGKVPAASAKQDAHTYTKEQLDAYVREVAAERGKSPTGGVARVLRGDILGQMHRGERPTAVGTSIYPPTKPRGEYDLVYSTYLFTTATHTSTDGSACDHTLVLDDGALFTVDIDPVSEHLVKVQYLPAITSLRHRSSNHRWGTTTTFAIPCGPQPFTHTITWEPQDRRFRSDSPDTGRSPRDPFGWRLRPTPRYDRDRFAVVNAGRNDSESFNNWYKNALPNKRAASITRDGQELDVLLAGLVKNSDTWSSFINR